MKILYQCITPHFQNVLYTIIKFIHLSWNITPTKGVAVCFAQSSFCVSNRDRLPGHAQLGFIV